MKKDQRPYAPQTGVEVTTLPDLSNEGGKPNYAEILENGFVDLSSAYVSGDFDRYRAFEERLAFQLSDYWKQQFLLYSEELAKLGHKEIPGPDDQHIIVDIDGSTMHIQRRHLRGSFAIRIYRYTAEAKDIVELEHEPDMAPRIFGLTPFDRNSVKIRAEIKDQEYPLASGYTIESSSGRIGRFERATTLKPVIEGAEREITRIESIGFYGMYGPTFY